MNKAKVALASSDSMPCTCATANCQVIPHPTQPSWQIQTGANKFSEGLAFAEAKSLRGNDGSG